MRSILVILGNIDIDGIDIDGENADD